jgi:DNA-(apurinic or apyrimidinic site) lyase
MDILAQDLSSVMNQKITDKTIVFVVKMFGYAGRNVFGYVEYYPDVLVLPLDSRLNKLFDKYSDNNYGVREYYAELAKKLGVSQLHLDSLLWIEYNRLIRRD